MRTFTVRSVRSAVPRPGEAPEFKLIDLNFGVKRPALVASLWADSEFKRQGVPLLRRKSLDGFRGQGCRKRSGEHIHGVGGDEFDFRKRDLALSKPLFGDR